MLGCGRACAVADRTYSATLTPATPSAIGVFMPMWEMGSHAVK